METLGKLVVTIILAALGVIIAGFVFMKLWVWFIVPVFSTLPVLTLGQSIGIATFIAVLRAKKETDEKKDFVDMVLNWLESVILLATMFGIAYIIFLFIN